MMSSRELRQSTHDSATREDPASHRLRTTAGDAQLAVPVIAEWRYIDLRPKDQVSKWPNRNKSSACFHSHLVLGRLIQSCKEERGRYLWRVIARNPIYVSPLKTFRQRLMKHRDRCRRYWKQKFVPPKCPDMTRRNMCLRLRNRTSALRFRMST